jgi:hypothetical protein
MSDIVFLNFLRIVCAVQAVFVAVATAVIVWRYIPLVKVATDRPKRLLAWHIIGIGSSYIAAIVCLCVDMLVRYGYGMTWRLPLDFFVFTSGDAALCLMIWRLLIMRRFYQLTERQ